MALNICYFVYFLQFLSLVSFHHQMLEYYNAQKQYLDAFVDLWNLYNAWRNQR